MKELIERLEKVITEIKIHDKDEFMLLNIIEELKDKVENGN